MAMNSVCAVVVTFHPSAKNVENFAQLRQQVETLVVVDNGSSREDLEKLKKASESLDFVLIENGANLGIGKALNQGVVWGLDQDHKWVILLDQDSTVTENFVDSMVMDFVELAKTNANVMQMIPRYTDPQTGTEEVIAMAADGGPFTTRTSGSLFPAETFAHCGFFTEELFIYCVDDDFSLRLRSMGYSIAQSKHAFLLHNAGHPSKCRFFGMTFITRNYRPEVQYYWARNRVWLVRKYGRRYPHLVLSSLRSLVAVPLKIAMGEQTRGRKIMMFSRGVMHGLFGKTGQRVSIG